MTDPQFRTALAAHGYALDEAGEITQLAPHVGAFSRRAAQIADSIDRYQTEWVTASATTTTTDPPISSRRPSGSSTATTPPSWS